MYVPPSIAEKSTTVYVGKIAGSVPDEVVRDLLDACGRVKSWKRQVDPDTKQPKGFGFCEFEDAEGVLRAMRLLNGLKLDGSELLLKCNAATQKYTEQYEAQKAAEKAERKARAAADKAAAEAAAAAGGEAPGAEGGGGGGGADGREEGEDGEADEDAAADNRVLEVVMSVVSEREEKTRGKLPPPPPLPGGGGSAAQAANDFLAQLGGAGGATPGSGGKGLGRERDREGEREREREVRGRRGPGGGGRTEGDCGMPASVFKAAAAVCHFQPPRALLSLHSSPTLAQPAMSPSSYLAILLFPSPPARSATASANGLARRRRSGARMTSGGASWTPSTRRG